MSQAQPRQGESAAAERSLGRWCLYWVMAFICLTLFYGALWLPLLDWLLGEADMSPDAPAIDRGVAWLIGGLVKGFFYVFGFTDPAMFTLFGIVASAEAADKAGAVDLPPHAPVASPRGL